MKKAFNTIREKWLVYLFEFIVILVSIISAFMLDSRHSANQDYQKETLILEDISDALSFDLKDIRYNIDGHALGITSADIVRAFLKDSIVYHDSLETHFGNIIQEYVFFYESSAYESYKSYGTDLIRTRELRKAVARLYEFDYPYLQNLEAKVGNEFFDPNSIQHHSKIFSTKGSYSLDSFKLTPRNAEHLKNDGEYEFYVNYHQMMRRFILSQHLRIETNVMEVLTMIEDELKSRKR